MARKSTTAISDISRDQAKEQLWRQGVLSWKLNAIQQELYKLYHESPHKVQTWLCSRRSGKSYALFLLALEECLKKPNTIVKFVCATKKQMEDILQQLVPEILVDCPEDIRPKYNKAGEFYHFFNGSKIQIGASNNGNAGSMRGGNTTISIVDEAQETDRLHYLVTSVLGPTTLMTGGKVLIAGTSPEHPESEFVGFIEKAEAEGSLVKKTIYDNSMLSPSQIQEAIDLCGGVETEAFRREYLCELVRDAKTVVFPEFTESLAKEITQETVLPVYFDAYVGMDLGMKDNTALIFGYFDFRANKLIIEQELIMDMQVAENTLDKLGKETLQIEKDLWLDKQNNEIRPPYKRVSDHDLLVIKQLAVSTDYKLKFDMADKTNLESSVNNLRERLIKRQIIINPRCTTLLRHLKNVKWKKGDRAIFDRSAVDKHYDTVPALLYLLRAVDWRRNPYPAGFMRDLQNPFYPTTEVKDRYAKTAEQKMQMYQKLFRTKK